jgi:NodT family efflux transporter outer membrane factor (OMF) lipoprotein
MLLAADEAARFSEPRWRPRWRLRSAAVLTLALLGGCNVGDPYKRPSIDVPPAFRATPASAASAWPDPGWWHAFGSPTLDRLMVAAHAANFDLAAAVARVREADAQVAISGAPLLPTLSATGQAQWQQTPITQGTSVRGVSTKRFSTTHLYTLELNASYEIDFWGLNRANLEAAHASLLASRFDQETVALTVEGSVATTWVTALGDNERVGIAKRNLADAEHILAAIRARLDAGTATALDAAQQQALVEGLRASIPNLQSQVDQQVIALGILIGEAPEAVDVHPGTLDDIRLPPIIAGMPSDLLLRRPDVAHAEAQLVAQNADITAARAAFFPAVTLTGAGGLENTAIQALTSPNALVLQGIAAVTQTIFDNSLKAGTLHQNQARYEELVADYRKAVVQSFTDVDTALTQARYTAEQEELQRKAVEVAQRAADIARAQVAAGTIDLVTALASEQTLYGDLDTLAQVRLARALALVNLYKALGGGWTVPATEAAL